MEMALLHDRSRLLACALALGLTACAPAMPPAVTPEPMIVGGWRVIDPNAEEVQAAAGYAAGHVPAGHGALAKVSSAQTQVVAGSNYRMTLHFADGSSWQATVWRQLDGSFALTEARPLP